MRLMPINKALVFALVLSVSACGHDKPMAPTLAGAVMASTPVKREAQTALDLDTFEGCGPCGDAKRQDVRALNMLKNRYYFPTDEEINPAVTLQALLEPGDDRQRWKVREAGAIVGYCVDVKVGGVETVNCHAKDPAHRDTHIEIAPSAFSPNNERVVVEVTPRLRYLMGLKGVDWSTRALRDRFLGRKIRVAGWLFLDTEHLNAAENTAPGRDRNWRGTAWELHPVTSISVTQ